MKFWRKPLDADTFVRPTGEIFIIDDRCKGCGFCIEFCPNDVFVESTKFNKKGYHPPKIEDEHNCIGCRLCEFICPEFAIFVKKTEPESAVNSTPKPKLEISEIGVNNAITKAQKKQEVLTGEHFMNGDEACAEGGIAAGCKFFGGYPITPATEISERMSRRLPKAGGIYIQMEDEIAAICAVLGASAAGKKAMSATSGPGFSLMMENFGLGIILEIPCVLVNIQRGGPSTGLPTLVGQADMMQARWGSHGDYEVIALSPSSPQECFDFVIKAFNLSEQYRMPILVMADAVVGHMTEKVVIPRPEKIKHYPRRKPRASPANYLPFKPDKDLVPPMANAGEGYHIHFTGLTHDERGYPVTNAEVQGQMVRRLIDKVRLNAEKIIDIKEYNIRNADVVIIAYGISARGAFRAMRLARKKKGLKVGLIKLNTVWPFPERRIKALAKKIKAFVVPEINYGQIALEVERCAGGHAKTKLVGHGGGAIHTPDEILDAIVVVMK